MPINRTLVALAAAGLAATATADVITSDFNASDEGWLVADGNSPQNQSVTALPKYYSSDGNDQGFITSEITWSTTAFFVAPNKFLGDMSAMFGGTVEVDRRFTQPDYQANSMQVDYPVDITMTGLDGTMTLAADLSPVSLTSWEHFSVELRGLGQWVHLDTGVAATDAEVLSLLGDLEDIRVRGNIRANFARIGIDNFTLVPAPGAASILAVAGLFAARRRR